MDISFSDAIDGFLLAKQVAGASPYTIRNYSLSLSRFADFLGPEDPSLRRITSREVRGFIRHMQTTEVTPAGVAPRKPLILSSKTIRNIYMNLSSLWTWAVEEEYADENVVQAVTPPKPSKVTIDPLTEEDARRLLRTAGKNGRPQIIILRDKATIRFLLDTGVRASELCKLGVKDVDLKQGAAYVVGKSRLNSGQGKGRMVYFGSRTRKALWQYLTMREATSDELLFVTLNGGEIDRRHLTTHLRRLGERADVDNVYAHRFRHTFAINYLRNGGDIFTLQRLLGHTSMDMVKRYLKIAQADCETAHRKAGPVDNWQL